MVGEIERLVDEGVKPRGDRGLLPHQRACRACSRTRSCAREIALPGDRRHEVLRARRGQGRDRLPARCWPTRTTWSASRASCNRPAAASARRRSPRSCCTPIRSASPCGRPPSAPPRCPAWARRRRRRSRASRTRCRSCARACRRAPAGRRRRAAGDDAVAERLRRGAGGRAHDRGAGAHREP